MTFQSKRFTERPHSEVEMASIHEVAKAAGVSISTVSYALSGKRSIGADTRRRIDAAVAELGYRANAGARMLAGSRTNILALTAPLHEDTYHPAHMRFVMAVTNAARARDYDTLLLVQDDATAGLERVTSSALADGVVVLDVDLHDERIERLRSLGARSVFVGIPEDTTGLRCVDLDFEAAAALAVDRLADAGRRSIGLVGHPEGLYGRGSNFPLRFRRGFGAAVERRAVLHTEVFPEETQAAARSAVATLVERLPGLDGLVLNCNEPIARAILAELAARGIDVPGAVSVVAGGANYSTRDFAPPLDVIPLIAEESCERAVELLVEAIEHGDAGERVELIAPRYVTRGSVVAHAASEPSP